MHNYNQQLEKRIKIEAELFWEEQADPYMTDMIGLDPAWEKYAAKHRKELRGLAALLEDDGTPD
jgi:hypothetical protein